MSDLLPGMIDVGGRQYMADAKGALVPAELVKPQDKLQDQLVRKILVEAEAVSASIAAFKTAAIADVDAFLDLLEQQYQAKAGGPKGNVTLMTFDGSARVQIQVTDSLEFGPELQSAKDLVLECLNQWAANTGPELRAVVENAFRVDKAGQINRSALFGLLRLDIADPRWRRAMEALKDSIRVIGSRQYIRVYRRAKPTDPWSTVPLDAASA